MPQDGWLAGNFYRFWGKDLGKRATLLCASTRCPDETVRCNPLHDLRWALMNGFPCSASLFLFLTASPCICLRRSSRCVYSGPAPSRIRFLFLERTVFLPGQPGISVSGMSCFIAATLCRFPAGEVLPISSNQVAGRPSWLEARSLMPPNFLEPPLGELFFHPFFSEDGRQGVPRVNTVEVTISLHDAPILCGRFSVFCLLRSHEPPRAVLFLCGTNL